jgi:phospholipid/cholesterol/gamma-HCH transport system substrate-binding protein
MERQANYVLVGVTGVVLLIAAFVFVVWLAHFQFNQQFDHYRVIFRGPVSGLSKGGQVQFNGIKVGDITRIVLDETDPNRVLTDLEVQEGTPVRVDSAAQTVSEGITGVKFVQISPGTATLPLLRKASHDHPPIIMAKRGRMEDLMNDASKMTANGAEALGRVNKLLSDANIATLSASLSDVQATTAELKARRSMFARMDHALGTLDRSASELELTLASARGALGGKDKGALGDIAAASSELRGASTDLHAIVSKADGPVSELSTTALPQMTATMNSVQKAADRLDSLSFQIEQNPRSLLTGRGGKEVKVPQ